MEHQQRNLWIAVVLLLSICLCTVLLTADYATLDYFEDMAETTWPYESQTIIFLISNLSAMGVSTRIGESESQEVQSKLSYMDPAAAETYDRDRFSSRFGRFTNGREMSAISNLLEGVAGVRTILDAPCGTGRMLYLPSSSRYVFVGVDISIEMIKVAKSKQTTFQHTTTEFVNCDLEYLPFKPSCVDLVLCIRLLPIMPPTLQNRVMAEFSRVTRKGLIASHADRWTIHGLVRRIGARVHLHPSGWYQVTSREYLARLRAFNFDDFKKTRLLNHISETLYVAATKQADIPQDGVVT